jgi:hypothetical protein
LRRTEGRLDRSDADPDRRTRRFEFGGRVPQPGGRTRRLGEYPARRTAPFRSNSSCIPTPITHSTRRT